MISLAEFRFKEKCLVRLEQTRMSFVSNNRHAFIIQLWREPREIENAPEQWRGIIEHTTTGQRCAIFTADDIIKFIGIHVTDFQQAEKPPDSVRTRLGRTTSDEIPDDEPPTRE